MNKIQMIIFDMDGLMFDTEAVTFRAFHECGEALGLRAEWEEFMSLIGIDMQSTCERYRILYGEDFNAEDFYKKVGERLFEILDQEGLPMKPGLLSLLTAIEEKGLKKVVASGSSVDSIKSHLKKSGILHRFDDIISSDEVEHGKPYPDVFLEICKRQGIEPKHALVLEDSTAGIQAACNGNIPVIGIPDLLEFSQETKESCMAVGETLLDVIPFLS